MKITAIVACGKRGQLGYNNKIPWHCPEDLQHFKKTTHGGCLIMGRKTYDSIGKPLPGRKTIVISSKKNYRSNEVFTVDTPEKAFALAKFMGFDQVFICGGGEIYRWFECHYDEIIISHIDYDGPADAWFNMKIFELNRFARYYKKEEDFLLEKYVRIV